MSSYDSRVFRRDSLSVVLWKIKTISEDVRKTIAKSRLYEWSMTRFFGRDAVVSRYYLYNCKTCMVKNSVYLFRIHFAGKFRIGARLLPPPRQMLFLFRFYFILSHSLASSSLLSFSLSRGFSSPYFRFLSLSSVVTPCRQHLRRSSLFPLGCFEPFVMILRIHGGRDVSTRNNPSLT